MKKLIALFRKHRALKLFADKNTFTYHFKILSAPPEESETTLLKIFFGSGFKRYFNILFKREAEVFEILVKKNALRTDSDPMFIWFKSNVKNERLDGVVGEVMPGQRLIFTIMLSKAMNIRMNNRMKTIPVDASEIESGYTLLHPSMKTVNEWIVKLD